MTEKPGSYRMTVEAAAMGNKPTGLKPGQRYWEAVAEHYDLLAQAKRMSEQQNNEK